MILYSLFFYDSVKLSRPWQKIYKYFFFFLNVKQPTNVKLIFLLLGPYLSLVPSKYAWSIDCMGIKIGLDNC